MPVGRVLVAEFRREDQLAHVILVDGHADDIGRVKQLPEDFLLVFRHFLARPFKGEADEIRSLDPRLEPLHALIGDRGDHHQKLGEQHEQDGQHQKLR